MNTLVPGNQEAMKFILKGRTFDTATAITAAIHRGVVAARDNPPDHTEIRFEDTLYRTASGIFFTHEHNTEKFAKGKPVVTDKASVLLPESAIKWIEDRGAMVLDDTGLPMPPEAEQESYWDDGTFKEDLISKIERTAEWRDRIAKEHPEDARNQASADALKKLAADLSTTSGNRGGLLRVRGLWMIGKATDQLPEMTEAESEFIGRYGFDAQEGDVSAFLSGLNRAIEAVMR